MRNTSLGVFFFGLLGLCLVVTGLGALGFNLLPTSMSPDQIFPLIFGLAGICLLIGFVIQYSGKLHHRK